MARTPPGSLFSFGAKAHAPPVPARPASPQTAGGSRASENPADGFADGMMVLGTDRGGFAVVSICIIAFARLRTLTSLWHHR
ncbi:hypothetical protein HMP06_3384 [Sphingomonas sp. HMP6]|nr:hypothetical protein HMP06_3384 [Sphingomonas sp. HMP6]